MFVQITQGHVRGAEQVKAALDEWVRDVAPGAEGWLRTTSGVTDDGVFVSLVSFTDAASAHRNSDRPEQAQWWERTAPLFDGEVTFHDADNAVTDNPGDPDSAKFVQLVQGQGSDRVRALTVLVAETGKWAEIRPEVLGVTACTYGNGEYTVAVYFANERDARVGERKPLPADLAKALAEVQHLRVRQPSYLDLHTPWISVRRA
ncbi:hypothetical protein DFJ67_1971 [Asanoa ferruginea]|uniref:Antibiotic biosynthesis monooxygenase n=1 Tax=Asanoa ferruginea TaxID=53367 RepID=A0A3D9ZF13_9ACTN|nr:hypothetical protein [Asanoa ferruginea]REF96006.1 hypothetical protein DFJ67_1971 [Asanoa ferruginea]